MKKTGLQRTLLKDLLEKIKSQVGNKRVLLGLSGGVDSSVVGNATPKIYW